jgi:hypothetical protein
MVNWSEVKKTIQIDDSGPLMSPKDGRRELNLSAGRKLKGSADEKGIHLAPVQTAGQLVRKGRMLVFRGAFDEPVTTELVERMLNGSTAR